MHYQFSIPYLLQAYLNKSAFQNSPKYRENHPYGWQAIQAAKDLPMMTDALPHLLLYLGGIATPLYRPELNIISSEYNKQRPRILKGVTDYNTLKK